MIEGALILVGGFLGSAHCVGMCGPFAIMIGAASRSPAHNLSRQVLYGLGRIFTYTTLGAMAGYGGWRAARTLPVFGYFPALLSMVAGVLLIYFGLRSSGILRARRSYRVPLGACVGLSGLRQLFQQPRGTAVFLAGVYTGLLPCGLTYAFLTLASSAMHMGSGALTMAAFGLGTMPAMILTGYSGSLLTVVARQRLVRAAGWCVIATGMLAVWRGAVALERVGGPPCPYCEAGAEHLQIAPTITPVHGP